MFLTRFHFIAIGGWIMAIAFAIAVRVVMGLPPSLAESILALGVAILPAVMILVVFRGAPPQTIAEVLYEAEHSRNPVREQLIATAKDAE